MVKDLEADSLDAVEIIMSLEDEFNISVPDDEAENFESSKSLDLYTLSYGIKVN